MKIAIFSAGVEGEKIYNIFNCIDDIEVLFYVDNNANILGREKNGIKIISPYLLKNKLEMHEIDWVLIPSTRMISYGLDEFVNQMNELEISRYQIIPAYYLRKENISENERLLLKEKLINGEMKEINQLQHLQFHIIDKCNLNCRRCQHFSNIVEDSNIADFSRIEMDLKRIRELFDDVNVIAMLGGEPLLNPELEKYCYMVREKFPYATIQIITNGLLVTKMTASLVKAIKENNIIVNISFYPVLARKIDEVVVFLRENNLRFMIGKKINQFSKKMSLQNRENVDLDESIKRCRDRCCTTLRDGKLYPCYLPATVGYFNSKFNENIKGETSAIDIYDENIKGLDIVRRLKRGFDICKYCTSDVMYPWEQSKIAEKEDWLV